jgi:Ca2+/H+ antiporter
MYEQETSIFDACNHQNDRNETDNEKKLEKFTRPQKNALVSCCFLIVQFFSIAYLSDNAKNILEKHMRNFFLRFFFARLIIIAVVHILCVIRFVKNFFLTRKYAK